MRRGLLWAIYVISYVTSSTAHESQLRPEADLVTNCFDFPSRNFDTSNAVKNTYGSSPHLVMDIGDSAVDFTLHDISGQPWNLKENLEKGGGKPVVMIWGMSTCPAYQGLDSAGSDYRWTYWDESGLVESHGDKATFVHMYGPEPHPTVPDTNFDSGKLLPNFWSVTPQHFTYDQRLGAARDIAKLTHHEMVILPDYLPGNGYSELIQPVWCSYAMGARPAVVVTPAGVIFYQQDWLNTDDLAIAIDTYWSQGGQGTWNPPGKTTGPRQNRSGVRGEKGSRSHLRQWET